MLSPSLSLFLSATIYRYTEAKGGNGAALHTASINFEFNHIDLRIYTYIRACVPGAFFFGRGASACNNSIFRRGESFNFSNFSLTKAFFLPGERERERERERSESHDKCPEEARWLSRCKFGQVCILFRN